MIIYVFHPAEYVMQSNEQNRFLDFS